MNGPKSEFCDRLVMAGNAPRYWPLRHVAKVRFGAAMPT